MNSEAWIWLAMVAIGCGLAFVLRWLGSKQLGAPRPPVRSLSAPTLKPQRKPEDVDAGAFESFERGFDPGVSGCRAMCECGRVFWDSYNRGYDWEDGEIENLERLTAEGKATALDYGVGYVSFEGRQFVNGCTCWHERARRVIAFLTNHDSEIAEFLKLERERKMAAALRSPTVEPHEHDRSGGLSGGNDARQ